MGSTSLAVANARKLTSDNPSQQRRLDLIGPLIKRRLDELDQTIYLRRNVGFQSALEVIVTDAGVRTMDALRAVIAEMERDERQLLEQRDEATAATSKKTKFAVIIGTIVSTVIFGIVALFLSRTNSKLEHEVEVRKRADELLREVNLQLEELNRTLETRSKSGLGSWRNPRNSWCAAKSWLP